eukprot:TRINITY_DN90535_c0_g1_i1.p1 TRINITY_DN90535_c0_g1~~TRINITY_DN90535_c0_g1_i1.p1  ORF type:complete len:553 (-),score=183.83 TRINITY_DN90535_c0_g1_i1:198-1856(-)
MTVHSSLRRFVAAAVVVATASASRQEDSDAARTASEAMAAEGLEGCEQPYTGREKPCKDQTLVIDVGGNIAKAWCYEADGKPVQFPGSIRASYHLWNGNKLSRCKEPQELTAELLKEKVEKFEAKFGKPARKVVSMASATESPGPKAVSARPPTLPAMEAINWENNEQLKDFSAINDVHGHIIGGMQYAEAWSLRHGRSDGNLHVITVNLGTVPSVGYAQKSSKGKLKVAERMSWMYGKNSAHFKKMNYSSGDRVAACDMSKDAYKDEYYSSQFNLYVPELEKDMELVMDSQELKFVKPGVLSDELQSLGFKFHQELPFNYLLRQKNVQALIDWQSKNPAGTPGATCTPYLSPNAEGGKIWRQRVTQALYAFTEAYEREVPCSGTNNHIVLMGGNQASVGGMLHQWVARRGSSGVKWTHVLSGEKQQMMPADLNDFAKDVLKMDSPTEPIANFGHNCKFTVHMAPVGQANPVDWGLMSLGGPVYLNKLKFEKEVSESQWFPFRKPEKGGYCTADAVLEFQIKELPKTDDKSAEGKGKEGKGKEGKDGKEAKE